MSQATATTLAALLLAGGLLAARPAARAELPWAPPALREARARSLERALQTRLMGLNGVERAHAQVRLADPLRAPVDGPLPVPEVRVDLEPSPALGSTARDALTARARELAETLVERARSDAVDVRWLTPAPPPAPTWTQIGPFRVHADSAPWLRGTLLGLLATCFALAALLLRYLGPGRGD